MNDLVIDSSVAIKWFVVETHTSEALRILTDYRNGHLTLLAPELIYAEFGNILWKKQQQGLAASDAEQILTAFLSLGFLITSHANLLEDAHRLAVTYQRTVYDALYLALSLQRACPCVTADERLYNAVQPHFPNLIWLPNWV